MGEQCKQCEDRRLCTIFINILTLCFREKCVFLVEYFHNFFVQRFLIFYVFKLLLNLTKHAESQFIALKVAGFRNCHSFYYILLFFAKIRDFINVD